MNLFELFVKIGVDDQASNKLSSISSKLGKGLKTAAKIGTAAVATAAAGIAALTTAAVNSFAEYEQLAGGAQKIFDQMDYSKIAADANNAYKELGLSANQYLAVINDIGATFAATMGDEAGYKAAQRGLKAISDYASGTGKNVNELSQKFTLITRSTSSYQSIADQFSGILPATSSAFLEQAQAAGILSESYTKLTEVPIDEYQEAVSQMLEKGVKELGLFDNTVNEAFSTLSGSLTMAKGAWSNLVTGIADDSADLDMLIGNFVESVGAVAENLVPKIVTALNSTAKLIENLAPLLASEIPLLVADLLPSIVNAAVGLLQSFVGAIIKNGPALIQSVLDSIFTLLTEGLGMSDSVAGGIVGVFEQAFSGIGSIASSLWDVVEAVFGALSEAASSLGITWDDVFGAIGTTINFVVKAWSVAADLIVKAIDFLVSEAKTEGTFVNELISGIIGLVSSLWELCVTAFEAISAAFSWMVEQASTEGTVLNSVWNGLKAVASMVWGAIKTVIITAIDAIRGVLNVFTSVLQGDWSDAWSGIKEIASTVWESIVSIFGSIVETASNGIAPLVDIGSEIVNKIKDGIASKWNELASWFNNIWDSLFGNRSVNVDVNANSNVSGYVDGSHASGLPYVPFDGYIAELHKGERVLTEKEAKAYGKQATPVTIVQNIYSEAKTASDLMQEALYQQERAVLLGV